MEFFKKKMFLTSLIHKKKNPIFCFFNLEQIENSYWAIPSTPPKELKRFQTPTAAPEEGCTIQA